MARLALVGFMASGKSTVGRSLATYLRSVFIDTDEEFARLNGMTPAEYIRTHGESQFRLMELESLKSVCSAATQDLVLATGGGLVTYQASANLLKESFFVIWLRVHPQTVIQRVQSQGLDRPLLSDLDVDSVEYLMKQRQDDYQAAATAVVDVDNLSTRAVVERIHELIR